MEDELEMGIHGNKSICDLKPMHSWSGAVWEKKEKTRCTAHLRKFNLEIFFLQLALLLTIAKFVKHPLYISLSLSRIFSLFFWRRALQLISLKIRTNRAAKNSVWCILILPAHLPASTLSFSSFLKSIPALSQKSSHKVTFSFFLSFSTRTFQNRIFASLSLFFFSLSFLHLLEPQSSSL